jgi:tight adherence protein B
MSGVALGTASHQAFWSSTLSLALIAGGCALFVGFIVALILIRRTSRGGVRDRVGEFLSPPDGSAAAKRTLGPLRSRILTRSERVLEHKRWWGEFKEKLELARVERPAIEIIYITAAGSLGGAALIFAVTSNAIAAVATLVAGPLVARGLINRRLRRQRTLFADQLAAHLQEMSAAIRAGHSLISSIAVMVESAAEPTGREFQRVIADEQLGVPLQDCLRSVAERMQSRDMNQVALVAELHQRTGGNMAEVLDRVAEGVRDRAELNAELRALTSQARLSRSIVSALPVILLGVIYLFDPTYAEPLLHTGLGNFLLVLGACMVIAGSLVMSRIARIEV